MAMQHKKVVLDAICRKAYPFFRMQPKHRRKVNGQLANVARLVWASVCFGAGKHPGLVLIGILLNISCAPHNSITDFL